MKFMVVRRTTNSSFEPSTLDLCGYYFSSQFTDPLFSLKRSSSARMKIKTGGGLIDRKHKGGIVVTLFARARASVI